MDPTFGQILSTIGRNREVKTLMGLTGRVLLVVGGIAIATIASAGPVIDPTRTLILEGCGGFGVLLILATYIVGIFWPERFHYGADQLIEIEKMARGDSLSGPQRSVGQPKRRSKKQPAPGA